MSDAATTKRCVLCRFARQEDRGELQFERHGFVVTITDVPMFVCEACGERYVPGPLGVELSDLVEDVMRKMESTFDVEARVARPRPLVLQAAPHAA